MTRKFTAGGLLLATALLGPAPCFAGEGFTVQLAEARSQSRSPQARKREACVSVADARGTPRAQDGAGEPKATGASVHVIDQDLRAFISDLARKAGLQAEIAATIKGRITDVTLPADLRPALRDLEKRYEFDWAIEGASLKLTPRAEVITRILPLDHVSLAELRDELKIIDFDTTRYSVRRLCHMAAVAVKAPAPQVERVGALIEALKRKPEESIEFIRGGKVSHLPKR